MGSLFTTYNDRILIIGGGMQYQDGSHIVLIGKDSEKNVTDPSMVNGFAINTGEDETYGTGRLIGKVNGSLTWNELDLANSAIIAKNITKNGYIKYKNGLIIQWIKIDLATINYTIISSGEKLATTALNLFIKGGNDTNWAWGSINRWNGTEPNLEHSNYTAVSSGNTINILTNWLGKSFTMSILVIGYN